ncbi:NAD(P)H-dependent oxidoreductase [Ectothiorhodospiraceae bacterium 2226]|nr:NAD(P)H-dependent oxidoreductase [Ectothiorhodospiraceae bacterium 2226]
MKVLVILGHPRNDSLCAALAQAYARGARESGATVREIALGDIDFDPTVHTPSPRQQPLEPDLARAQAAVAWADHLVFVYPNWWGTMPALLKGFLDRVFTPGFAFRERPRHTGFEPLLRGKTAQLISTMDTPPWVYRWILRAPGTNGLRRATLGFCGIRTTDTRTFGPVNSSTAAQRRAWLTRAEEQGRALPSAPAPTLGARIGVWLRALRLQFYPMTLLAYAVGALAASSQGVLSWSAFWIGFLVLFLLEATTVFINDYYDYPSDRRNRHYSPFSGGSRVLVEGAVSFPQMRRAILGLVAATAAAMALLWWATPAASGSALVLLIALTVIAIGYTAPPLKLAWRGLGELDVGVTHSLGVILCGYVFQGGSLTDPLPWLLALPLLLAVLPAIILAGLPDYWADQRAGKATLVVRLGRRRAVWLAVGLAGAAAFLALTWQWAGVRGFEHAAWFVVPHAALLVWLLARLARRRRLPARIDGVLATALAFILWFGLVPLVNLV